MTDDDLLVFAAKAAGFTFWRSKHGYWNVCKPDGKTQVTCQGWENYDSRTGEKLPEPTISDAMFGIDWAPLADDGDALRLAVKLKICIGPNFDGDLAAAFGSDGRNITEPMGDDPEAAARRAIVRAAAEIGKDMP